MELRKIKFHVTSKISIDGAELTEEEQDLIIDAFEKSNDKSLQNIDSIYYDKINLIGTTSNVFEFWGNDIELELPKDLRIDENTVFESTKEMQIALLRSKADLVKNGNGAVSETGQIVDAREFPDRPKIEN